MKLRANCKESLKLQYLIQSLFTWIPSLGALLHNWGVLWPHQIIKVFWIKKIGVYLSYDSIQCIMESFVSIWMESFAISEGPTVGYFLFVLQNVMTSQWDSFPSLKSSNIFNMSSTYKIAGISFEMIHSDVWCLRSLHCSKNLIILCFRGLYCNKGFDFRCFYVFHDCMDGAMH